MTALGYDRTAVVSHDIGIMVAYAYAARYPDKVERLVVMDAPPPRLTPWDDIVRMPALSGISPFAVPTPSGSCAGASASIWTASGTPSRAIPASPDEATRNSYAAQYARAGAMRAGFAQFAAFAQDAEDNRIFQRTKLTMPVLAIGGGKILRRDAGGGDAQRRHRRPRSGGDPARGHWLMEESPGITVTLIETFLKDRTPAATAVGRPSDERRVTPGEFSFPEGAATRTGTSGVSGIQTVVLKGDPDRPGLYTIMLRVPAHTRIAPHDHQDERVATVISGTWYLGYGDTFDSTGLKALPPGSFYTEPSNRSHFAETREEAVIVQITGVGPSSTRYVDPASDPRRSGSP